MDNLNAMVDSMESPSKVGHKCFRPMEMLSLSFFFSRLIEVTSVDLFHLVMNFWNDLDPLQEAKKLELESLFDEN